jgi:hypothetical protein
MPNSETLEFLSLPQSNCFDEEYAMLKAQHTMLDEFRTR